MVELEQEPLEGRYLKALVDRPNCANYQKGDYIKIITHDENSKNVKCEKGYIFGRGCYDWKNSGVELMPEGFDPNMLSVDQLVKGEIYVSLHDEVKFNSLFVFDGLTSSKTVKLKHRLYLDNSFSFQFNAGGSWIEKTKFRHATAEEKQWLQACIDTKTFISKEEALKPNYKTDWKVGDAFKVTKNNPNGSILVTDKVYYVFKIHGNSVDSSLTKNGPRQLVGTVSFEFMEPIKEEPTKELTSKFVLPKNYYIECLGKTQIKTVQEWWHTKYGFIRFGCEDKEKYYFPSNNLYGFYGCDDKPENSPVITFEQFKKYVLKENPMIYNYKYPKGKIRFKEGLTNVRNIYITCNIIPPNKIIHGSSNLHKNYEAEIVDYYNEYYIVKYLDVENNYTQLAFLEKDLYPVSKISLIKNKYYKSTYTDDNSIYYFKFDSIKGDDLRVFGWRNSSKWHDISGTWSLSENINITEVSEAEAKNITPTDFKINDWVFHQFYGDVLITTIVGSKATILTYGSKKIEIDISELQHLENKKEVSTFVENSIVKTKSKNFDEIDLSKNYKPKSKSNPIKSKYRLILDLD